MHQYCNDMIRFLEYSVNLNVDLLTEFICVTKDKQDEDQVLQAKTAEFKDRLDLLGNILILTINIF